MKNNLPFNGIKFNRPLFRS